MTFLKASVWIQWKKLHHYEFELDNFDQRRDALHVDNKEITTPL